MIQNLHRVYFAAALVAFSSFSVVANSEKAIHDKKTLGNIPIGIWLDEPILPPEKHGYCQRSGRTYNRFDTLEAIGAAYPESSMETRYLIGNYGLYFKDKDFKRERDEIFNEYDQYSTYLCSDDISGRKSEDDEFKYVKDLTGMKNLVYYSIKVIKYRGRYFYTSFESWQTSPEISESQYGNLVSSLENRYGKKSMYSDQHEVIFDSDNITNCTLNKWKTLNPNSVNELLTIGIKCKHDRKNEDVLSDLFDGEAMDLYIALFRKYIEKYKSEWTASEPTIDF